MIHFERTTDLLTVRRLLTEPRCYRRMVNDSAPATEEFQVNPGSRIQYVLVKEQGRPVGVFLLVDEREVHFCLLPCVWGRSVEVGKAFLDWVWVNYPGIQELIGPVPSFNRLALRLALASGFVDTGQRISANVTHRCHSFEWIVTQALRAPA